MMIYKRQNVIVPKTLKISELETSALTRDWNDSKSSFFPSQQKTIMAM